VDLDEAPVAHVAVALSAPVALEAPAVESPAEVPPFPGQWSSYPPWLSGRDEGG
jgi:hypothetical protein